MGSEAAYQCFGGHADGMMIGVTPKQKPGNIVPVKLRRRDANYGPWTTWEHDAIKPTVVLDYRVIEEGMLFYVGKRK